MVDQEEILLAAFAYYRRLQKVKEHTDQNLEQDITLAAAARIAGMEKKYFSTFFHQKTGVCFKDWIARARIRRAAELIRTENHTITTTALAVGFHDLRTFERTFKRWMGMTARDYKKSVQPRRMSRLEM